MRRLLSLALVTQQLHTLPPGQVLSKRQGDRLTSPQLWGLRGKCTPEVCPSHPPPGA